MLLMYSFEILFMLVPRHHAKHVLNYEYHNDQIGLDKQCRPRTLLIEDKGLHCLLFHLHHFDKVPQGLASLFEF